MLGALESGDRGFLGPDSRVGCALPRKEVSLSHPLISARHRAQTCHGVVRPVTAKRGAQSRNHEAKRARVTSNL